MMPQSQFDTTVPLSDFVSRFTLPRQGSRKGHNGKVLIVGGSELFHAAGKWSLDTAAALVDMVFFATSSLNGELVQQAKGSFWNGIVISFGQAKSYGQESDSILIGPGMERTDLTKELAEYLFRHLPEKKWVIDAGALQMADPALFPKGSILTPHSGEWELLKNKISASDDEQAYQFFSSMGITVLLKGAVDRVILPTGQRVDVPGGNPGMTKGGTGDVLAGLVAGLAATQPTDVACVIASMANKQAADELYSSVGPFFTTSQLAIQVPQTLWNIVSHSARLQPSE